MDKFEYKVRSDEIKTLIAEGDYAQAAEIADTIDWRRVKSVMTLCTISDLYKINRRYDDAKNVLMLAYERRPGGRTICYSLCELCIKTGDFVQALNYFKEFVQVAPRDTSRYVLQYKLYEAQDVSLEERIAVLEELKKRDYREKWAYELAFLYHRVGLATRCVEECDELALWFGDGKYVVKALELKMLHQPLTPEQQRVYDHRFDDYAHGETEAAEEAQSDNYEGESEAVYDTSGDYGQDYSRNYEEEGAYNYEEQGAYKEPMAVEQPRAEERIKEQAAFSADGREAGSSDDMDIQVKTMDVGKYNTINLQAELAAGLQEVLGGDQITHSIMTPMLEGGEEEISSLEQGAGEEPVSEEEEIEGTEVFFGETGEMAKIQPEAVQPENMSLTPDSGEADAVTEEKAAVVSGEAVIPGTDVPADETGGAAVKEMRAEGSDTEETRILNVQPPKELADVLSQEANGQISMVLPESTMVEKQLTGQMKIEDVLAEWERMKEKNREKCQEAVRQRVLRQTGPMFTEFEASVRDGLLEKLEKGTVPEAAMMSAAPEDVTETAQEPEYREGEGNRGEAESIDDNEEKVLGTPGNPEEMTKEEYPGEPAEAAYIGEEEYPEEPAPEYAEEENPGEPVEAAYIEEEEYPEEPASEYAEEENPGEPVEAAYAGEEEYPEEPAPEYAGEEYPGDPVEAAYAGEEEYPEEPAPEYAGEEYPEDSDEMRGNESFEKSNDDNVAEEKAEKETSGKRVRNPRDNVEPFVERDKAKIRGLTREEKELYAPFIQSRHSREQIVKAIDNISMAAYTGNVIITGEEGMDTMTLAKNMIREVRMMDSNFSGKVAKISGEGLNQRNMEDTLEHLSNGALIIQAASGMSDETANALHKNLQQGRLGIVIFLEDTKKGIKNLFSRMPELAGGFTARMDLEALSNDMLVSFGRRYAREMEYSIDDLGVLALHTRIEELQTIDHAVTVIEVKQIVDEAIHHASRKTLGHFFDILFAKRYDDEDMIVLTEKDFVA